MSDVTVLHNSACSTSRHAIDEVAAAGVDAEVVQYLKKPLTRDAAGADRQAGGPGCRSRPQGRLLQGARPRRC
ncbi:hypothetical protein [Aeromicrobium sp. UC242_57]|uniref:hypothetical protein n=1 Tax=Aeromicrobium sp. UC242_57 TaxID=3374624 RepID=UPI00379C828A